MFALVCGSKGKAFSSNNPTKLCYFYFLAEQVENYFKISSRYLFLTPKTSLGWSKKQEPARY